MDPIKRHQALVEFSRDHHFGLLLCWKIRKGLSANIEAARINDYILYFFDEDLKEHFSEEEKTLFSRLDQQDPMRIDAESQHQNIYRLIEKIRSQRDNSELSKEFATSLDDHIRFEERQLFNHLQKSLSDEDLAEAAHHSSDNCRADDANWKDHFWAVSQNKTSAL